MKNIVSSKTPAEYVRLKVTSQQTVSKQLPQRLWALAPTPFHDKITSCCKKTSTEKIEMNVKCYSFFFSFYNSGSIRIGLFFKTGIDNIWKDNMKRVLFTGFICWAFSFESYEINSFYEMNSLHRSICPLTHLSRERLKPIITSSSLHR